MPNNPDIPFNEEAEHFNLLVEEYIAKLRLVHQTLSETELREMAEKSAYMHLRMGGTL